MLLKHIKCRTNRQKKREITLNNKPKTISDTVSKQPFLLSLLGFSPQVGSLRSETNSMCSVVFPTATRPNVSRLVNDKLVTIMMLAPASVLCHTVVMTISCIWSNLFCGRNLTRRSFAGLEADLISGSSALKYGGSRSSPSSWVSRWNLFFLFFYPPFVICTCSVWERGSLLSPLGEIQPLKSASAFYFGGVGHTEVALGLITVWFR